MVSRRITGAIAIGIVTAIAVYLLSLTPVFQRTENQYGLGLLYALRGPVPAPDGAVIVAIDRYTTDWLRDRADGQADAGIAGNSCMQDTSGADFSNIRGPSSLPRSVHGCLVRTLSSAGVPVIAFDILFSVRGPELDDKTFADAIRDHGATVVLTGIERSTVRDRESELLVERPIEPTPAIADAAASVGTFIVPRSVGPVYGYWRAIPGFDGVPPLPDETYRIYRNLVANDPGDEPEQTAFRYLWLYGAPGAVPTISASAVLTARGPQDVVAGAATAAAFVGASDPAMTNYPDSFPSFFQGASNAGISGVELAATAFLNLKNGDMLRRLPSAGAALTTVLFVFLLGFAARAWTRYALLIVPAAALVYLAGASYAFSSMRLFFPVSGPIFIGAPLVFLLAVFFKYSRARTLLMRLAPAPVAQRMLRRESEQRSGAVDDEATVIFFDLIGSTGIAENLPPIAFSRLLNGYHDTVTKCVERHHGQIISFSGDGVMSAFSQRDTGPDHAASGCRAALEAVRNLRAFNLENNKVGLPPLRIRIGINSGNVAEGEIGAVDRFNFSVVGDVVNLAAKLEQLGKTLFPDRSDVILLGEETKDRAGEDEFDIVDCGQQKISGRIRTEHVFLLSVD